MKYIFLLVSLLVLTALSLLRAQALDSTRTSRPSKYYTYLEKANANRKGGRVLLVSGLVLLGAGSIIFTNDIDSEIGPLMVFTGFFSSVASIPCFIAAGRNKHKAKLSRKEKNLSFGNKILPYSGYPALALTISL